MSGQRPEHRIDNFSESLLVKLEETYRLAIEKGVDFVVFMGDFFNSHRIFNYEIINSVMDIICSSRLTTYAIVGQHDTVGYNPDSYRSSTLNFMERHCPRFETMWEPKEFDDVVLYPCHCYDEFLPAFQKPITRKKKSILVAHHLITRNTVPFETYLLEDFLPCKYSAVIFGDFHFGMRPYYDENETLVWSPGALARQAINEKTRVVRVGVVEVNLGKRVEVEEIQLNNVRSGDEVFAKTLLEEIRERPEMVDTSEFVQSIRELEATSEDIFDMLEKAAKKRKVRKPVINYILAKRA